LAGKFSSAETSNGHSHSHTHSRPHPHADPPTPPPEEDEQPDTSKYLPTRLDRLVAFLDSYFGHVELIKPEESRPSLPLISSEREEKDSESLKEGDKKDTAIKASETMTVERSGLTELETIEGGGEDAIQIDPAQPPETAEDIQREEVQNLERERVKLEEIALEHPRVPVIRVHLDEYFADVTVETLVCFFLFHCSSLLSCLPWRSLLSFCCGSDRAFCKTVHYLLAPN
jgi:cleavage and polyadenylation specificity factor subunit 3